MENKPDQLSIQSNPSSRPSYKASTAASAATSEEVPKRVGRCEKSFTRAK